MVNENQCLSSIGNKYVHWRENWKYQQHDDSDDAKFQLLQNPVTYRDCEDKKNINFKITPVGEQTNRGNAAPDELSNKAFKKTSDNYIRSKGPREQNIALSV